MNDAPSHYLSTESAIATAYTGRVSYLKIIILGVLTLVTSIATGYLLEKILYQNGGAQSIAGAAPFFWPFLVAFLLMLSFLVLVALFVSRWWMAFVIWSASAIAVVGFLIPHMTVHLIVGAMAFFLIFVSACIAGRIELKDELKIRFFRIAKVVLVRIILACAILVSVVFFDAFASSPLTGDNFLLPESVFEKSIDALGRSGLPFAGKLDLSLSLEQLTEKAVQESIQESGPLAQSIPKSMIQQMTVKYLTEYQNKIKEVIGVSIDPNKKLSLAIYQGLLTKFNALDESAKTIALSIVSVLIFLTAMALSPFIRWAAALIGFILYRLVLLTGIGSVIYEPKSKEILILP